MSSWESDDEILLEDNSTGTFSRKEDEVIDEDALLGIGESTDNAFNNDLSYEIQLDDSASGLFDMTGESQEVLDYEDTYQEGAEEESDIHEAFPVSQGNNQALVVDSKPNKTTTKIQITKIKAPGNESDSDSDEEKKGRDRFKTERQTSNITSSTKHIIPDKLEVTKEMQDQIESFEKQKNQKGRQNQRKQKQHQNQKIHQQQKQLQQQQRQYHQQQMNRHNAGQMRHPRPGGPRAPFMHQQRGPNPNFRPRQPRPPVQRGQGPDFPRGFPPGPAPQPQGPPRPLMQQGPGPFPHEMIGQNNNFSAPQQFSQPQQIIHTGPSHLQAPSQPQGSQPMFNPAPASLVHSSAAPHIHVNPKFHGSQPQEPPQHHPPPHSMHQSPHPGSSPQPPQQPPQPQFMPSPYLHTGEQGPRPLLLSPPRGMEPPRPHMMHPQHHGAHIDNRGPGPQGQPMFLPRNHNQAPGHNVPPRQFAPQGGPQPNMPHPHQPQMQPRHPHQPQNQQYQQHPHQQHRPQHPGPHQQRHPNQNNVRPQRFQHPNQQPHGPGPRHPQPNFNQQMPQPEVKQELDPERLAKQREIEERKKKRLERFSQNATVVPSSDKPTTVKLGSKRASLDGHPNLSAIKIIKLEPKIEPEIVVDSLDTALEIQKRQREKIRQLKEAKRQQEAINRRKQLEQKLAKEGKTLADIEPQPMEQLQSIPTVSGGQQVHQQHSTQHQHHQQHQIQHHQNQQHQNPHFQQQQQQQTMQTGGQGGRGVYALSSRGASQPGRGRAITVLGQGQVGRGKGQVGRGQGQVGRGQGQVGRGINVQPGLKKKTIPQGQPIRVLGQTSSPDPAVNVNKRGHGRGQLRGRGRGQTRSVDQPRSNILQAVQITEDVEMSPAITQNPQRTVLPARQVGHQQTMAATGMTSMGAASQGQGQKGQTRVVVANKIQTTPQRTVLSSNNQTQRRIVMGSSLHPGSSSIAIEGLSSNVDLGKMNGFCSSTGDVKDFNYRAEERTIFVRFASPGQAAKFVQKYNRTMVDLTMIRVKQVEDF